MKKLIIALVLVHTFLNLKAQDYELFVNKADSCYKFKNYALATDFYVKAFGVNPNAKKGFYNAACVAALSNNKVLAFKWLNIAIENGFDNLYQLKSDTDLTNLHSDQRWQILTDTLQKKADQVEANYNKPLQQELISIFYDDQLIRQQYIEALNKYNYQGAIVDSLGRIMKLKDSLNLIKIIKILDENGWVGKNEVGQQASQTIFLVIQHSELKVQQKYLPLMRDAVKNVRADAGSLALLEDRVALGEGRMQIYGSQIGTNPTTKKQYILPLYDPDNVDKRRQQVGLGPLADYVKNWNIIWDVEKYKQELPEIEKLSRAIK